jgi:hypothetical protein
VNQAFRHLLQEKRQAISARWRERVLAAYPSDAARFMGQESDPFANPVGQTTIRVLEALLDYFEGKTPARELSLLLDDVLRIRAVQTLPPSQAVGFIVLLKGVVEEELKVAELDQSLWPEFLAFSHELDELTLKCFETYLACREKLYELKATELRRRSQRVVEKLNERLFAGRAEPEEAESPVPSSNERGGTR